MSAVAVAFLIAATSATASGLLPRHVTRQADRDEGTTRRVMPRHHLAAVDHAPSICPVSGPSLAAVIRAAVAVSLQRVRSCPRVSHLGGANSEPY